MQITLVVALFVVMLLGVGILELVARNTDISKLLIRKIGHVGLCLVIIGASFFINQKFFILIGVICAILDISTRKLELICLKDFKKNSYGELLYMLGVGLAGLVCDIESFRISLLVLGFADSMACIVGTQIKSKKIILNKTIAGSLSFFVISFFIIYGFTKLPILSLYVSVVATMTEMISPYGSDNLFLPIVVGTLLTNII
jgi:dolichol kinase